MAEFCQQHYPWGPPPKHRPEDVELHPLPEVVTAEVDSGIGDYQEYNYVVLASKQLWGKQSQKSQAIYQGKLKEYMRHETLCSNYTHLSREHNGGWRRDFHLRHVFWVYWLSALPIFTLGCIIAYSMDTTSSGALPKTPAVRAYRKYTTPLMIPDIPSPPVDAAAYRLSGWIFSHSAVSSSATTD
ncbi:hypothetical protein B0H10DRAFT_1941756 [Mycena sp. CBHHK59/15]|nr:hypothetical protein B0H10DRAFT_1941756 [Mycena sp. CBHHK59/15]